MDTHEHNAGSATIRTEHWIDGVQVTAGGESSFHRNLEDAMRAVSEAWIDGESEATIERAEGFYGYAVQAGDLQGLIEGPHQTRQACIDAVIEEEALDED